MADFSVLRQIERADIREEKARAAIVMQAWLDGFDVRDFMGEIVVVSPSRD